MILALLVLVILIWGLYELFLKGIGTWREIFEDYKKLKKEKKELIEMATKNILEVAERKVKKDIENLRTKKCLICLDYITKKEFLKNNGACDYCYPLKRRKK